MDTIPVPCAKCGVERDHEIRFKEITQASVEITARCSTCGNTIKIPFNGVRLRPGQTMEDRVREIMGVGNYKRAIRGGKRF